MNTCLVLFGVNPICKTFSSSQQTRKFYLQCSVILHIYLQHILPNELLLVYNSWVPVYSLAQPINITVLSIGHSYNRNCTCVCGRICCFSIIARLCVTSTRKHLLQCRSMPLKTHCPWWYRPLWYFQCKHFDLSISIITGLPGEGYSVMRQPLQQKLSVGIKKFATEVREDQITKLLVLCIMLSTSQGP